MKFYTNFSTLGVVAVVVSGSTADPRDSLVPPKLRPTPLPTVTVYATPGAVEPTPTPTATK